MSWKVEQHDKAQPTPCWLASHEPTDTDKNNSHMAQVSNKLTQIVKTSGDVTYYQRCVMAQDLIHDSEKLIQVM